jgi:NAD(P)-dependent dehydrogenase (short-subunit alcohol dehydrogenase family)
MRDLDDRRAVVTGAARGIGRALAEAFTAAGMHVVLSDVDADAVEVAAAELPAGSARAVAADVSRPDDIRRLADAAFADGPVHLLCNNAGIVASGRTWELPLETWRHVIGVDLWGPIHAVHEFVPRMIESGAPAHIVNIASMASVLARPGIAPYNVSKHGLLALSETLHHELRAAGLPIGVTTVFPGRVDTALGGPSGTPATPERGLRSPAEVAARVLQAVCDDELFVFTHPDRVDGVVTRFRTITGG